MQVQKIQIKNFKLLQDIDIALEGKSIIVLGPNNVGKSSLIDAVFDTLQNGDMPSKPIRNGADKGEIVIEVGDNKTQYIVKKSFTPKNEKGYLTISTPDGATYNSPVSHLNNLFGTISLDLEGLLSSKDEKEVAKKLKAFVGIDTTKEDLERKGKYNERTSVNRDIKILEPLLKDSVDVSELLAKKADLEKKQKERDPLKEEMKILAGRIEKGNSFIQSADILLKVHTDKIEAAKKQIAELEQTILDSQEIVNEESKKLESAMPQLEQLKKQKEEIAAKLEKSASIEIEIQQIEKAISESEENQKNIEKVENLKKESEKLTNKMAEIDEKIKAIYKAASTQELEFTEDGVLYNGLPLEKKQINTAGLAKLALDLAIKSNPKLHAVRFDASFMDNNTFKECVDIINEAGFQAFVEMVDKDGKELTIEIQETLKQE